MAVYLAGEIIWHCGGAGGDEQPVHSGVADEYHNRLGHNERASIHALLSHSVRWQSDQRDREQCGDLLRANSYGYKWMRNQYPGHRVECADDDHELVGSKRGDVFNQWFGDDGVVHANGLRERDSHVPWAIPEIHPVQHEC